MPQAVQFARLDGTRITVVWMLRGGLLDCLYFGPLLEPDEDLEALALARSYGRHENAPDVPPIGGLVPDPHTGWRGPTLLDLSKAGVPAHPQWQVTHLSARDQGLVAILTDATLEIELHLNWNMRAGDVIAASSALVQRGAPIRVERLASLHLPLPRGFDHVTYFSGRWADDMRAERMPISRAGLSWASRGGKSGFAGGDFLIFDNRTSGGHIGFHFAHPGDHETRIERNEDGLITLTAQQPIGPPPPPALASDWRTPLALFTWGHDADALTHAFHSYARHRTGAAGTPNPARTRKVHFNTWEACAFDFDEARLMDLADEAAALGAERFVLDDGWFMGRSSDRAGLGDWTPDPDRFPNGLTLLIEHVKTLGMDFGLWVEPEMISPDSDLYRAHPDWCLHVEGAERPTERNQLVLDLSKREVFDHIFGTLNRLLGEHDIAYLKWDHNRRHFPHSGLASRALADAFHRLTSALRHAHPHVMIESCSSGGGRIDMHTLGVCERFWPSDNNDPIERVRIMREWSRFLPLEVLGNHVGPSPNPITGRATNMDFRAKIALFGHMGIEADPGAMSEADRKLLAQHIALYKRQRALLHSGQYYRLDHPDPGLFAQMVVGEDTALAIAAQTGFSAEFQSAPVRLKGLDPAARYRVHLEQPWPAKAALYLPEWQLWSGGIDLSGMALMTQGLALPLTHPETAWLIALETIAS